MTSPTQHSLFPILWDVVEEHLDESAFLFGQWRSALYLPTHNMKRIAATLESRLAAHLDGLVVGGPEVSSRLLSPALADNDDPDRAAAAALVLLSNPETYHQPLEAIRNSKGPLQDALARATVLSAASQLDQPLVKLLESAKSDEELAMYLRILTQRGIDPGEKLRDCLELGNSAVIIAALQAVRRFSRVDLSGVAAKYLDSPDPEILVNAILTGITFASWRAWNICLQGVSEPQLLPIIAMLGDPSEHEAILQRLDSQAFRITALWSLGYCGTARAGDACLPFLASAHERTAKAAAEALAWIGGFDLTNERFHAPWKQEEHESLPPLEEDLDTLLQLDGVDALPSPNQNAITQWWQENRNRLAENRRNILGQPFSPKALIHALESGSLWRRHGVALEVALRTGGKHHISTDAFTSRQLRQLDALSDLRLEARP